MFTQGVLGFWGLNTVILILYIWEKVKFEMTAFF